MPYYGFMVNFRSFFLALLGLLLISTSVRAVEIHSEGSEGGGSMAGRGPDDTRTVTDGGTTYHKRLLKDGIQFTVRVEGEKEKTSTYRFSSFVGKDVVRDGRGSLTIAYLPGQRNAAVAACMNNGMRSTYVSISSNYIICSYSVSDDNPAAGITLERIHNLFFAPGVCYLAPDPIVSLD